MSFEPYIVGVGGTARANSSSERALRLALSCAQAQGSRVELFAGESLVMPMYSPESANRPSEAARLVAALRAADGIILASPGYHGSVSGLLKNALDYVEDMREDPLPYFEGRAVGLIACACGWQSTGTTLVAMRSIVHALRGWPTPLAVAINSVTASFNADGSLADQALGRQMGLLAQQVVDFAHMRARRDPGAAPPNTSISK
jgi:FMN reductase